MEEYTMAKTIDIGICGTQHVNRNEIIREKLDSIRKDLLNGNNNNALCYDGIVSEKDYKKSDFKLAFLLKETNGNDSDGESPEKYEDWDYIGWIRDIAEGKEKLYPTFRNIAMWSAEFFDIMGKGQLDKSQYIKDGALVVNDELVKVLKKIALLNLKKTWGKGTTDWNDLNDYLLNEKARFVVRDEISLINPDVVICGSNQVFDFACNIYNEKSETIATKKNNKLNYFKYGKTVFVSFYHPSCRKGREMVFDYAEDIFEALKTIM